MPSARIHPIFPIPRSANAKNSGEFKKRSLFEKKLHKNFWGSGPGALNRPTLKMFALNRLSIRSWSGKRELQTLEIPQEDRMNVHKNARRTAHAAADCEPVDLLQLA